MFPVHKDFKVLKKILSFFVLIGLLFFLGIVLECAFFDFMGRHYNLAFPIEILLALWVMLLIGWAKIFWFSQTILHKKNCFFVLLLFFYVTGLRGLEYSWGGEDRIQAKWLGMSVGPLIIFGDTDQDPLCFHDSFWFFYIKNSKASFKFFKGFLPFNYASSELKKTIPFNEEELCTEEVLHLADSANKPE